jgi:LAGLIDADG endonuclease
VTKEGYVGFEMTLPSHDEKVLRIIQNKFGGNIKPRAGIKAVRYRSQNKITIIKIIQCLNGLLVNNIRLVQLHKACLALNISIKDPIKPTIKSAYISGLLDSDGTLNFYKQHYKDTFRYQLTISIANKSRSNIEFLLDIIGGTIYFDKSENGCYFWKANSKLLHFKLYEYFLKFPPKTIKGHRTHLIKEFHELNELKAYKEMENSTVNLKR